jgi:hypothetical protein
MEDIHIPRRSRLYERLKKEGETGRFLVRTFGEARRQLEAQIDDPIDVMALIRLGKDGDKGNALYDYLAAEVCFAAGNEEEALRSVEKAVGGEALLLYGVETARAAETLLEMGGCPSKTAETLTAWRSSFVDSLNRQIWRNGLQPHADQLQRQGESKKAASVYRLALEMVKALEAQIQPLQSETDIMEQRLLDMEHSILDRMRLQILQASEDVGVVME